MMEMKAKIDAICAFIKQKVEKAGADGVAIGVSGGLDSAVTAALCCKALGKENVYALIMPEKETTPEEVLKHAREVAEMFSGRIREVDFTPIYKSYSERVPDYADGAKIPNGNLRARIRMCMLYYYANKCGLLVAGTGDKSEIMLGYFTKYGDGGVDFLPIGGLFKTEVREVGKMLGVPAHILEKKPSPNLWAGQTAEGEIGADYSTVDALLRAFASGATAEDAAVKLKIKGEVAKKIKSMTEASAHKRAMPEICELK